MSDTDVMTRVAQPADARIVARLTAITDVRAKGAAEVHINVDEVDVDTRRFYERHGFVNVHPGTDYRMLCYLREL